MKRLNSKRIITTLTIIATTITLISVSFIIGVRVYIWHKLNINSLNNVGSIGIIGGSDGPTVIYYSGMPSLNHVTVIFGVLSIIGIIYLKKFQKEL